MQNISSAESVIIGGFEVIEIKKQPRFAPLLPKKGDDEPSFS
jgi:hypothetical protein